MSGFFTGFKPKIKNHQKPYGNLELKKKPQINEYTDNLPLRRSSYLTDDESDTENKIVKSPLNNSTKISEKEKLEDVPDDNDQNKENATAADTVIDTVCTRMSNINVKNKTPIRNSISESLFGSTQKRTVSDTVIDTPAGSQVLQEIDASMSSKKQLFRDGDSWSSDEKLVKNEPVPYPENMEMSDEMSEDEIIQVLDSDDEIEIQHFEPPLLSTENSFINCSENPVRFNNFFNNPPSLQSNIAVTHSMIQRFKNGEKPVLEEAMEISEKEINVTLRKTRKSATTDGSQSFNEHVEIGPTDDESDAENDNIVDLTAHDESGPNSSDQRPKSKPASKIPLSKNSSTPISINIGSQTPTQVTTKKKKGITNVKIHFDLKISIKDGEDSSDESITSNSASAEQNESFVHESHLKAIQQSPFLERKSSENQVPNKSPEKTNVISKTMSGGEFKTPKKVAKQIINEEMQGLLNEIYGETWKTPEVLSSFKIKKFREDLRKSLSAHNFKSFTGSLTKDLESTRITSPKSERLVKSQQNHNVVTRGVGINSTKKDEPKSIKKTASKNYLTVPKMPAIPPSSEKSLKRPAILPSSEKTPKTTSGSTISTKSKTQSTPTTCKSPNNPRTPLHLLCDPDTSSESDSDDDYDPNDTWNASSDEEYKSEVDRIKKRQSIKHEVKEMIFTLDDSLNEVMKKYQFQPKPQVEIAAAEDKPRRRKLFTHLHFDDEHEFLSPKPLQADLLDVTKLKDTKIPSPKDLKRTPAPKFLTPATKAVTKTPSATKTLSATKIPLISTNKTTKIDNTIKKDLLKQFSTYSFVKSLDVEANRMLCDKDALYYRDNFKTKKAELADKLFKIFNENVFDLALSDVPMKWNKKLQTTGGRCNNSRRNHVRSALIELSDKVLTSADRLRCTLIHEMCHAATWIVNGENGHGVTWKKWTVKASSAFPELPKITVCHSYVIEYRYTYLCMQCKARSQMHSKSKKVEDVRCSICKGTIQLFENKKNAKGEIELVPVKKREPSSFAKFVKLKFKEVKTPYMNHKDVMRVLSEQFSSLSVQEKENL